MFLEVNDIEKFHIEQVKAKVLRAVGLIKHAKKFSTK